MRISEIKFINHPILKNLEINFTDSNGKIFSNIIFVGENGCGKTTLLNELFNYDNSTYIRDKEQNYNFCGPCSHKSILIAQDLKYREAINNIANKMNSKGKYKDITDINNTNGYQGTNVMSLNKNNIINTQPQLNESIKVFNNTRIVNYFTSNQTKIMNDISKFVNINGNIDKPMVDTYSSGEQELILRIESIKSRVQQNLDMILIDEPETSLHPKWQQKIIPFIIDILKDNNSGERDLQLFVSSHSENILKSVFNIEDTLIVRLYKEGNDIKSQNITNMDTRLCPTSLAEIQYLVFDIPSVEYHNQLYGQLFDKFIISKQSEIDNKIKELYTNHLNEILNPYNFSINNNNIETLPTYIRNATSHTENKQRSWNENDLEKSIKIMRAILKN